MCSSASSQPSPVQVQLPSRNYAGYLFDLDGTLIDTMPLHYRAWDEAMRRAGMKGTLDEDLFYSLGGVPTLLVADRFAQHYSLEIDREAVMHEKEQLYLDRLCSVALIEPVAAFARDISRTHPVAIVTGGLPDIALPALKAAGLDDVFKVVITPADVPPGRGKPAPDMFLLAAERLGVEPSRCVVFEDAEPGLQAARAAGMTTVEVRSRR